MLLLDQTAERIPIWTFFNNFSFYGQPFAWLAMNNMGGNLGLVGSLEAVNQGTVAAAEGGHGGLKAIGLDPEGINNNPVYWEFVSDSAWRSDLVNTSRYLQVWWPWSRCLSSGLPRYARCAFLPRLPGLGYTPLWCGPACGAKSVGAAWTNGLLSCCSGV